MNNLTLLCKIDWSALAQILIAISTAALAIAAGLGLQNWKKQFSTTIKIDVLDGLVNTSHRLRTELQAPIFIVQMIKTTFTIYKNSSDYLDNNYLAAYYKEHGKRDGKSLTNLLKDIKPIQAKLSELLVKGNVLSLEDYDKCETSCINLHLVFGQLSALAAVLSLGNLNFNNPEVQNSFTTCLKIKPDEMLKEIQKSDDTIKEFAKESYSKLLN